MNQIESEFREKLGDKFKTNVVLRDFTSMKVGGVADYFFTAESIEEIIKSVDLALKLKVPYFILAGGYNVVISDIGFPGLVIKNQARNIVFLNETAEVIADSGVKLSSLLTESASRDLGGLEFLFGIPGTVGGSIYNNAGSFKASIGDFVKFVTLLIPNTKTAEAKIVKYRPEWMKFNYRSSRLKGETFGRDFMAPGAVILTVKFQLARSKREVILQRMRENLKLKKSKQPVGEANAGSFFKNPGESREQTAGFLLDQIGAKKLHVGKAAVSKKHANFIINRGGARADDIKRLAEQLKIKVRDEYRITLQEEVEYVGRW